VPEDWAAFRALVLRRLGAILGSQTDHLESIKKAGIVFFASLQGSGEIS
jgi:hypothetical protein